MKYHPPLTGGHLEVTPAARLFMSAHVRRVTGALHLRRHRNTKTIYFRDGHLMGAASNQPSESLGTFMMLHGMLSTADFARSLVLLDRGDEKHGQILLAMGVVTEAQLADALRMQHQHRLIDAATWGRGTYTLEATDVLDGDPFPIWTTLQSAVIQRLGREQLLASARANARMRVVAARSVLDPYLVYLPMLFNLIGHGDGRYTVADLASMDADAVTAYVNLLLLKELGVVTFQPAAQAARSPAAVAA